MKLKKTGLNINKLNQITIQSNSATVAMLSLAMRERDRELLNIISIKRDLIRMGEQIINEDYFKFWEDLQKEGIGSLIKGIHGKPDMFKWNYSMRYVAKSSFFEVKNKDTTLIKKDFSKALVSINLPSGQSVDIIISKDLNKEDTDYLVEVLRQGLRPLNNHRTELKPS